MLAHKTFLTKLIANPIRAMSTASIKDRFEAAYEKRKAELGKVQKKIQQPKDTATYGKSYYQDKLHQMKTGYVHPYHSDSNPIHFTTMYYLQTLYEAVGPEQVSPHYESLSRSRRGLIFLFAYIGTIVSVSRMGGWSHNEWIRGLVFHQEYLLAIYLGFIETRHFTYFPGPKFTVFYNVYTRYEVQQLCQQWADSVVDVQHMSLRHTKEQIDYVRLNHEYDYIKKRALINFLTNSRLNLENHFHSRTTNMLSSIERYEQGNLKALVNGIGKSALDKVHSSLKDPQTAAQIKVAAFQSALEGIREGSMRYKNDPLMPILSKEIENRVNAYKSLSAEEEGKLLQLNADQKRAITDADRREKVAFLTATPAINNPTVSQHPKFKNFVEQVKSSI